MSTGLIVLISAAAVITASLLGAIVGSWLAVQAPPLEDLVASGASGLGIRRPLPPL